MELSKVFDVRRSIRSFTGEAVGDDVMNKIIRAANESPVGLAKYDTLHLTIVRSRELLEEIEQNTARVFKAENRSFLYGAPELVIVSTTATDNVGYSNAAIVAQNMSLAAVDEGVGVCHIWGCIMALSANKELSDKLGIPEGFTPSCAIALGKTDEVYTAREIPQDRLGINFV